LYAFFIRTQLNPAASPPPTYVAAPHVAVAAEQVRPNGGNEFGTVWVDITVAEVSNVNGDVSIGMALDQQPQSIGVNEELVLFLAIGLVPFPGVEW